MKEQEKIKEILEKSMEHLDYEEYFGSDYVTYVDGVVNMTKLFKSIRQQTLEEAIASVPKEVFCQTQPMATDYGNIQSALLVEGVNKWNACRQQTLSNLQALKDKDK